MGDATESESQFMKGSWVLCEQEIFCFVLDLFHFVMQKVQLLMRSFWELSSHLSHYWDALCASPITHKTLSRGLGSVISSCRQGEHTNTKC